MIVCTKCAKFESRNFSGINSINYLKPKFTLLAQLTSKLEHSQVSGYHFDIAALNEAI